MPPTSKLGRGKPLKNQTKEVLHKLFRYFETEIARDPNSTVTASQLVTHSTGVSMNVIKRVLAEQKANVTVKQEYKSTKRRCKKNSSEDFDAQSLRRIIHNFYTSEDDFPIMKDIYMIMKADVDYQGSLCTLRRDVAKLGFKWMEKEDNNRILIEKHDYRYARVQYLSKIESYRAEGRHIVYTGDVAIETNRLASKPKPDGSSTILKQPAKSKLVIVMAGDATGIMKNTILMYGVTKRELKEENETKKESFEQYEKWFRYYLVRNVKPYSVIIVDGASPFHNRVSNPTPHSNSRKKEMMDYLTSRNVPYTPDMYKSQLYQLILLNKDKYFDYKTDAMLREYGHTVLRVPPHYPDLNPVKNILTLVKKYVGKDICLSIDSIKKIAKEKLSSIESEWEHAYRFSEVEANNLRSTDKIIDDISESAFKWCDDESEGSDMEEDVGSDQEESMDSE